MLDVHVPAHEAHLQPKDCGVRAVVGKDEANCVAISDPEKPHAEAHVTILVDGPVPGESFAKVGMEACFVAACATAAERNRMQRDA